jgi:hypothetical protein
MVATAADVLLVAAAFKACINEPVEDGTEWPGVRVLVLKVEDTKAAKAR